MVFASPITGPHRVHEFRGDAFEIGVQHGRALSAAIGAELERFVARLSEDSKSSPENVAQRVLEANERLFRDRVPMALEEIRGIAQGANLSYAQAFLVATGDGVERLPDAAQACTALACGKSTTADGHVLIGQNKDAGNSCERYFIMRYDYTEAERRMLLLNYAGWIANIGLTSDGMSFTGNARYARRPTGQVAPFSLLKRLVLESTRVSQVLKGIEGLTFDNGGFLVADRFGQIVFIESIAGELRIRDVSDTAFGHANSVRSDDLKQYELPSDCPCSSPIRQKHVQARLDSRRGALRLDGLKKILADHEEMPLSICRHACDADNMQTTASFVADLTAGEIHIAMGNPCAAEYRTYQCR